MNGLIVPLSSPEAADAARFGPKAANLARLGHAGLPIPDGFCVDAEAYRLQVEALGLTGTAREVASPDPAAARRAAVAMRLGLAQYDPPVISRIWSLDHPVEIQEGMVFALETQHGKVHQWGVRIEEMLIVHKDLIEIVSNFPVEQITVVYPMTGYSSYGKS